MKTELQKGIIIESEHTGTIKFIKNFFKTHGKFPTNKQIFKNISKEHLKEDPKYYTKISKLKL